MININEVIETNTMIEKENLDVRTITLGISLLDCISDDLDRLCTKIYDKITQTARNLVATGEEIEREYALPIVNKRISVTPVAIAGASACRSEEDFCRIAQTLDKAAKETGVNFLGGCGRTADPLYSVCAQHDRAYLLVSQSRFHKDRNQHGCRAAHGPDNP